jgi:hypothetical protein
VLKKASACRAETFECPSLSHFGQKFCSNPGNQAYHGLDAAAGTLISTRRVGFGTATVAARRRWPNAPGTTVPVRSAGSRIEAGIQ